MDDTTTKSRILNVAGELFGKFGFRSISMDDIAHQLGMSKKTIYQYFSDKNEIVTLAVSRHLAHEKSVLQNIYDEAADAIDFLLASNQRMMQNIKETSSALILDLRKYHLDAWTLIEQFRKSFLFDLLLSNYQRGIQQALFRGDVMPEVIIRVRLEEVSMPLDYDLFPKEKYTRSELAGALLDHFILGVATEKGKALYATYKTNAHKQLSTNLL